MPFRHSMPAALCRLALVLAILVAPPVAAQERTESAVQEVLGAVVGLIAHVPEDARTARTLGSVRAGSGVVIDQLGLVLTIGYLILEADAVEVLGSDGERIPATVVAYDHESGFGLVRAERPLGVRPMPLGDSRSIEEGSPVLVVSGGGAPAVTPARILSRRPFAGYWEYLLESAIFTFPPHEQYGGAALVGPDGRLVGIGSLFVGDAQGDNTPSPGNMFVPIEELKPILADLMTEGRRAAPAHPWLGLFAGDQAGRVVIARTAGGGPAEAAGLEPGDIIIGVDGKRVSNLADFFRKVWAVGDAGVDVPLDVVKGSAQSLDIETIAVRSGNRYDWLKLDHLRRP